MFTLYKQVVQTCLDFNFHAVIIKLMKRTFTSPGS